MVVASGCVGRRLHPGPFALHVQYSGLRFRGREAAGRVQEQLARAVTGGWEVVAVAGRAVAKRLEGRGGGVDEAVGAELTAILQGRGGIQHPLFKRRPARTVPAEPRRVATCQTCPVSARSGPTRSQPLRDLLHRLPACCAPCVCVCVCVCVAQSFTACVTAILCAANERVSGNTCVACPAGTTNAAGDDASGADTTCDGVCLLAPPLTSLMCTCTNSLRACPAPVELELRCIRFGDNTRAPGI